MKFTPVPMTEKDRVFKRRLLKLARFLIALPPERFDYTTWVGRDWGGKADLSCGTTACALGWATVIPEFRALGLVLRCDPLVNSFNQGFVTMLDRQSVISWNSAALAARRVFGVNYGEKCKEFGLLFVPNSKVEINGRRYYSPNMRANARSVGVHIRRFAERKYRDGLKRW